MVKASLLSIWTSATPLSPARCTGHNEVYFLSKQSLSVWRTDDVTSLLRSSYCLGPREDLVTPMPPLLQPLFTVVPPASRLLLSEVARQRLRVLAVGVAVVPCGGKKGLKAPCSDALTTLIKDGKYRLPMSLRQ